MPASVAFPLLTVNVVPVPAMPPAAVWLKVPPLTVTFVPLKLPVRASVPPLSVVAPV